MSQVKIFWDPQGQTLDALGAHKLLGTTDGDTPSISMSIRMLSVDAPEVHYPGTTKPSKHNANLKQLADWLQAGQAPVSDSLAAYLQPRLATGAAGTLQETQGDSATTKFEELLDQKLTRPNSTRKRDLFLRTADQPFDQYGRLLAYVAPVYTANELATLSRKDRGTFNLLLVDSGWAATFPVYPSLPGYLDLALLQECGKDAFDNRRGAWADPMMLIGYEFRMCVRLYEVTKDLVGGKKLSAGERESWIERYCVDMTTREIVYPQDYHRIAPYNRIFVWPQDVNDAVSRMNLTPAD